MNDSVKGLSKLALKSAVKIGKSGVPDTLDQKIVRIKDEMNREAVVLYLLNQETPKDVIVFVKTKKECHRLHLILQVLGKKSGELHGNLTQLQRLSAVNDFQNGDIDILITTDLAARGLDLPVKAVINMNIPREIQRLLHRIGRTARAGMSGISISLCTPNERSQLRKAVKQSIPSIKLNQELLEKAHDEISKANSEAKQMLHEEEMKKIELKRENEVKKEKKGKKPIKFKESSNEVAQADEQSELANKIKRHKLMASLKKRISDENKS
eukprot:CAMPEP_0202944670 /NCGR_PEP_ID=MMETSP1395-20130829/5542_1 /ASSEMBLY_ACC=CAM_ASM_000871 /TAXON_ID=5961 /ORGANISM="Blepharisma japonicum, Strain Stock R1072" /LENGTH=268 /DNA_ID=CAMNT_0049643781 /DNA_START=703 /DNA_END=1509 /DNA_ORIENTATION=-